jgi:DNA-binding response OmpR family regulator
MFTDRSNGMQKMKILVAEDDPLTQKLLEKLLTGWGYEVVCVHDGQSARLALEAGGFHICILDWEMPELSGRDLCEWIRAHDSRPDDQRANALRPSPYVILLTARGNPQHICAGFAAGADDYITKPFDRDDLRFRLATLALRVMRTEALGEAAAHMEPMEMYRLDLSVYSKALSLPT